MLAPLSYPNALPATQEVDSITITRAAQCANHNLPSLAHCKSEKHGKSGMKCVCRTIASETIVSVAYSACSGDDVSLPVPAAQNQSLLAGGVYGK